jgi:hypothetical protein
MKQALALLQGMFGQFDIASSQIAQATMDHFR